MEPLHEKKLRYLEELAVKIRETLITTLLEAGSGHSAGPLGMADIMTALYFHVLRHNPKKPNWPERDRLVLSNGHICPILYVTLAYAGYFPKEELRTLRKLNSRLQGHPHRGSLPGIETTSGPLGSGLSQAIGMALAARMDGAKHRVFCIASDGEHDEGNFWEALMLAGRERLSNLTLIVDRNNIQIDGFTEQVMPVEPLRAKYEAFNWHVLEIDGHSMMDFAAAVAEANAIYERPTVVIAHTIPGKGVRFMENDFTWHGKPPGREEAREALRELRTLGKHIQSEHE
jgi:transketolase